MLGEWSGVGHQRTNTKQSSPASPGSRLPGRNIDCREFQPPPILSYTPHARASGTETLCSGSKRKVALKNSNALGATSETWDGERSEWDRKEEEWKQRAYSKWFGHESGKERLWEVSKVACFLQTWFLFVDVLDHVEPVANRSCFRTKHVGRRRPHLAPWLNRCASLAPVLPHWVPTSGKASSKFKPPVIAFRHTTCPPNGRASEVLLAASTQDLNTTTLRRLKFKDMQTED